MRFPNANGKAFTTVFRMKIDKPPQFRQGFGEGETFDYSCRYDQDGCPCIRSAYAHDGAISHA